jgi:hypothetical protein
VHDGVGASAWRQDQGVAFLRKEWEAIGGPRPIVRRILPRGAGGKWERRIGARGAERDNTLDIVVGGKGVVRVQDACLTHHFTNSHRVTSSTVCDVSCGKIDTNSSAIFSFFVNYAPMIL